MFALWYLSLAIDEVRKHFGWSSIFDIFKTNKTAINNKTLDDKKPSSSLSNKDVKQQGKIEQPTKVPENVPKVAPAPTPIPTPTPTPVKAPEPPKPQPQPKIEPPKPVAQPTPPSPQPQSQIQPSRPSPVASNNGPSLSDDPLDKKLFGNVPRSMENGNDLTKPSANIKDATSSFLAGEGRGIASKPTQDISLQRYTIVPTSTIDYEN